MLKILETESDFDVIIKNGKWLVDFYAEWCGPCQVFGKIIENINFINVLKVNVDEFPNIAKKFGVMSIPTIFFYSNGIQKMRKIGTISIDDVKSIVDSI